MPQIATVVVGLFGGHRQEHQIDFLVLLLIGIVTVIVWAAGVGFFAYRVFITHQYLSSKARWLIGAPALVAWTVGIVLAADWVVE